MRSGLALSIASLVVIGSIGCSSDEKDSTPTTTPGDTNPEGTSAEIFDEAATPVATNASQTTSLASDRIAKLLDGLADSVGSMEGDGGTGLVKESADSALGNLSSSSTSSSVSVASTGDSDSLDLSGLEELLRNTKAFSQDYVFKGEYVESDDGTTVTYLVNPATACEGNAECVTQLTQNPLRFAVNVLDDDSISIQMLVGAERYNPASMRMSETALGFTADLSDFMDSLKLFMAEDEQQDLPKTFSGVVDLSLVKNADRDFTFSFSILEELQLGVESEPGKAVSVRVGASQPTSQFRIDANTNTMSWKQNLAAIDVSAAGALFCDADSECGDQERQGTFSLHLAGMTGQIALSPNSDEFGIEGYGFGNETSYVALNDSPLVSLDLNPNSGRTLNVRFQDTSEGVLVSFEPELDLAVATALNQLTDSLKVDMPEWLFDEVFDVSLGGAPKPSILIRRPRLDASGEEVTSAQLEVESGTLSFDATSLSQPVTIEAGMCVVSTQATSDGSSAESSEEVQHPFELIGAGVCE